MVQFNCDGISDVFMSRGVVSVSPDGCHMVYVHYQDGRVSHWDLRAPTLKPTGSSWLPGVEVAARRRLHIRGKETIVRDSISKQVHQCRYSPSSKVVTIVTATAGSVVVNVFLTFNFQLIYHYEAQHICWQGYVMLRVGFNDETGLNVFGASPITVDPNTGGVVGVLGSVVSVPDMHDKIKKIEEYFDTTANSIAKLRK
ncbi:hypothetical protein FQN49_004411 [Arthroderma sp. PD_2]|nr:hypothetical protein FQN49_004411 [Arthroderma sp. PD_2]